LFVYKRFILYEYNYYMILNLIFIALTSKVVKAQEMFVELLSLIYVFALRNFSTMKPKEET
jgi:hypothetical protein